VKEERGRADNQRAARSTSRHLEWQQGPKKEIKEIKEKEKSSTPVQAREHTTAGQQRKGGITCHARICHRFVLLLRRGQ
jgi:hypothetical protein